MSSFTLSLILLCISRKPNCNCDKDEGRHGVYCSLCCRFQVSARWCLWWAVWVLKSTLRIPTDSDLHPVRKFLLCSFLFWSLCCCMLISFRVSVRFGRHSSDSLNRPEPAGECGQCQLCLTAGRSMVRDVNQLAEAAPQSDPQLHFLQQDNTTLNLLQ